MTDYESIIDLPEGIKRKSLYFEPQGLRSGALVIPFRGNSDSRQVADHFAGFLEHKTQSHSKFIVDENHIIPGWSRIFHVLRQRMEGGNPLFNTLYSDFDVSGVNGVTYIKRNVNSSFGSEMLHQYADFIRKARR